MYTPTANGAKAASCAAHAVVLQLPLEGVLSGGGLAAVLKRPAGRHPEWLVGPHSRDFFISFAEVCIRSMCSCVAVPFTSTPQTAWLVGPLDCDFFISFAEVCLGKLSDLEILSQRTTDLLDAWQLGCYKSVQWTACSDFMFFSGEHVHAFLPLQRKTAYSRAKACCHRYLYSNGGSA